VTDAPISIRNAVADDLAALQAVFRRASWSNERDRPLFDTHPEFLHWSGRAIGEGRTVVAVVDGRAVGFASIVPAGESVELEDLFVDPDRMRRGVARALIVSVADRARAIGARRVEVDANEHALGFYCSAGFVAERSVALTHGTAIRMSLAVVGPSLRAMDLDAALVRANELAAAARAAGDHPFGALLLVGDEIVAESVNRVNSDGDLTAHAEMELVRTLARSGRLEALAAGVVVASTEPCPMCVGALFWAGSRRVVFGLSAARLNEIVRRPGDDEYGFEITAAELGRRAAPPMSVEGPHREDDAAAVHADFWT
jgi:tRNA(Arg) A34 adenosine deaminase TadA/GNAT superfamily N-acetyltransferase